jgi:hypothetical protein
MLSSNIRLRAIAQAMGSGDPVQVFARLHGRKELF